MRFHSLLVANRGEIAIRIARTAKALGYRTIAVYSEADADAPHVRAADDAVLLGPAPVSESYLNAGRLLAAAKASGAEAIHPGYGFLSENAAFARACEAAGLVFVGPSAEAIALMGNKAEAKRRMIAAGIPCVPGYEGEDQSDGAFADAAQGIGFPVMVKAAAGGGGRGMRLVQERGGLVGALALARSEAKNAFGSDELILEKAIMRPRHVEIQVFADTQGHTIHLGERDCSVQRRHQKVIEEAPCPVMTPGLRARMGSAAVEAARSIAYRGAGTVEFLLDQDGAFYFLEMNTRLQVEHPVTELITGLDLVALQLRVAQGEPLGIEQSDVRFDGHAIEVRLYAEDPAKEFLPSTGPVALWQPPSGVGVRVDAGIATGTIVSPFYDPMVAKIIAHGPTRDVTRQRLVAALRRTGLHGIATNRDFLIQALESAAFEAGEATTAFIAETFGEGPVASPPQPDGLLAAGAALLFLHAQDRALARSGRISPELLRWSSAGSLTTAYRFARGEEMVDAALRPSGPGAFAARIGAAEIAVAVDASASRAGHGRVILEGQAQTLSFAIPEPGLVHLSLGDHSAVLRDVFTLAGQVDETAGGGRVLAPMHGQILDVFVAEGARVRKGDRLAVLEAMKMQHEILALADGVVEGVRCAKGRQVPARELLFEIAVEEG